MLAILLLWVIPMAAIDPIAGAIAVALIAPVGAYLAAAHKMSGKIATTEAHDLWEESRAIREWSAARIDKCDEEIQALREQLREAKNRITHLESEKRRLEKLLREGADRHDF
jgi:flagellar motility protein MotE (MotC chaperone)